MSADGCILYLLPSDRLWLDVRIEDAQADALKQQLPLAAVTCILPEYYSERLPQLALLEATLAKHNLPLITLIGTEAATLPSLVKHAKPAHVYAHGSATIGKAPKLSPHPFAWPGIVIKTSDLKTIVDKKEYMC